MKGLGFGVKALWIFKMPVMFTRRSSNWQA